MKRLMIAGSAALAAAMAFGEAGYLQSNGNQAIDTGYYPNPKTAVTADFAYTATKVQQVVFGTSTTAADGFTFCLYINGSGYYAWACKNGEGNWMPFDGNNTNPEAKADTRRRKVVLDSRGNSADLATEGVNTTHQTISTTRSNTSAWPLAIFSRDDGPGFTPGTSERFASLKLYSLRIDDDGATVRHFMPYAKDGVTGLKDILTGTVYESWNGAAFEYGGEIGLLEDSGYVAAPAGFFLKDGALFDGELWRLNGDDLEYRVCFSNPGGTVTVDGETAPTVVKWVRRGTSPALAASATMRADRIFVQWNGPVNLVTSGTVQDASLTVTPEGPASFTIRSASFDDPYADATSWLRFSGEGKVSAQKMGSTLGGAAPWSSVSVGNSPVVTNELVAMPYRGTVLRTPALYLPQPFTVTNEETRAGYGYVTTCTLNGFTPNVGITSGDYTFSIRFRPDSSQYRYDYTWILNWGYSNKASGFNLGLSNQGTTTEKFPQSGGVTNSFTFRKYTPMLFKHTIANPMSGLAGAVHGDKWHDLIISIDTSHRKIRYVLCRASWDPRTHPFCTQGNASDKGGQMTYSGEVNMTTDADVFYKPSGNLLIGSEGTKADGPAYGIEGTGAGTDNQTKSFRGSIQQIMTWNRAMSLDEMKRALAWPRGDLMRAGVRDGGSDEFVGGTEMHQDDSTWTLPTAFAAGDSATVRFCTDRTGEETMPQVFRWYAASDSVPGKVGVTLNGVNLGVESVNPGKTTWWKVGAGTLVAGTNVLVVTRADTGTGALKLDAAALGGSWQIGHANAAYTDFAHEGSGLVNHDVLDGNWRSIKRVLFGCIPNAQGKASGNTNSVYHFTVPADFRARNFGWRLSWKDVTGSSVHHPLWRLNGTEIYSASADANYHTVNIPEGLLTDGDNKLEVCDESAYINASYYFYDYLRFEIVPRRTGLVILVR